MPDPTGPTSWSRPGDEITRLKRELVTYDAIAAELELYVRVPSLSLVVDTEIYVTPATPAPQRRTMLTPGTLTSASSTT